MHSLANNRRRGLGVTVILCLLGAVLAFAGLIVDASPAQAQPATCSINDADGGIDVTWQSVANADTYVYRLESEGKPNRYRRVQGTSTFIALDEGEVGTVFVSAVFADGSYSASAACGSGSANDGSGQQQPTCTVENADDGINVAWSNIPGAQEYVYRLEVDGQDNKYRRVGNTSTFIPLGVGDVGTVFVSGVRINGSYTHAIPCGSGQANDGTGQQPATCQASSAAGGINIVWTAVTNADIYVYRLEVDGQNNMYGVIPGDDDLTHLVSAPDGTIGTLFISAKYADGSYSPGVPCGTATAGDGTGGNPQFPSPPAECSVTQTPTGVNVSWGDVDGATSYIVYRSNPRTDQRTAVPVNGNSYDYDFTRGPSFSFWVAPVDVDAVSTEETSCGGSTAGLPTPPACTVVTNNDAATITWGDVNGYDHRGASVAWTTSDGQSDSDVVFHPVDGPDQSLAVSLNGSPVASATVTVSIIIPVFQTGGTPGTEDISPATCTVTVGGGDPQFPSPPSECTVAEIPGGVSVSWSDVQGASEYVVYHSNPRTDERSEFRTTDTFFSRDLTRQWVRTFWVAPVQGGSVSPQEVDCGSAKGGLPNGPACTVDNQGTEAVVTWGGTVRYSHERATVRWVIDGSQLQVTVGSDNNSSNNTHHITLNGSPVSSATVTVTVNVPADRPGQPPIREDLQTVDCVVA